MKSILISVKPKWVAKILNGEKTIEIRKTLPKCDLPIDVYIYCTKEDSLCCIRKISRDRYICGKDFDLRDFPHLSSGYDGKGKVVAKFTLNKVEDFYDFDDDLCESACLDRGTMLDYLGTKNGYAWHISNLIIFDKPKELSEFKPFNNGMPQYIFTKNGCEYRTLTKAPQNYCYIEGE